MKIISTFYLVFGIFACIMMSLLLLAQYNVVDNIYSTANKDTGAKVLVWFFIAASILFIVVGITGLKRRKS